MKYRYSCIDDIDILEKISNDKDYNSWLIIVKNILKNKEFQKRRLFLHHENESLWTHSIKVSFNCYKYAKKHKLNEYNLAIAGLLHDFYTKAWQYTPQLEFLNLQYRERFTNNYKSDFRHMHGLYHSIEALENSRKYFKKYLNEKIEDAIVKHMFPLSLFTKYKFPKFKESWIVTIIDKYVSLNILVNLKEIGKYIGIKKINYAKK